MEHVADVLLLELVAQRLPPLDRQAVEAHLLGCAACRERRDQFARTWEALGAWELSLPEADLRERVLAAAGRAGPSPQAASHRRAWLTGLRVAAAVTLAVGVGHLAGRWTWNSGAAAEQAVSPDRRAVVQSLYLEDFQEGSPGYFAQTVLGFDERAAEESSE
jgi:predicted anti-sigma-YlaC factor YlaD